MTLQAVPEHRALRPNTATPEAPAVREAAAWAAGRAGNALVATAARLVSGGRGVLAADESPKTLTERFDALGIVSTAETRTTYRELLCSTPDLAESVSGVILHRETFLAVLPSGRAFPAFLEDLGLLAGVKVDTGTAPLPGHTPELVTEGLDGLAAEAAALRERGVSFAKWRAVIAIGEGLPSRACLVANATALARYALACQVGGLVPIVEPEVLMDGDHDLERCAAVTEEVLTTVFAALRDLGVALEGMLLKPSMVLPGKAGPLASVAAVAAATRTCYLRSVPAAVTGVALLSGGQGEERATAHLAEINRQGPLPWPVTFSFGRALQDSVLATWRGSEDRVAEAQAVLHVRAAACAAAARAGMPQPAAA